MTSNDHCPPFRGALANRSAAGRRLAKALAPYRDQHPVVLAVPRGGVPVGFQIAKALSASLDLLFIRKLRAPAGLPEFGLGAIVDGMAGEPLLDPAFSERWPVAADYIDSELRVQLKIIEASKRRLLGDRLPLPLAGCTVILVDDGVVTGNTLRAGLKALAPAGVQRLVLAVPVVPQSMVEALADEVDELVCLLTPDDGLALDAYYADFTLTTDDAVVDLLRKAGSPVSRAVPGRGLRPGV